MTRDTRHHLCTAAVVVLVALFGILSCSQLHADWPRKIIRWPTRITSRLDPASGVSRDESWQRTDQDAGGERARTTETKAPGQKTPAVTTVDRAARNPAAPLSSDGANPPAVPSAGAPARATTPAPAAGGCSGGNCGTQSKFRYLNFFRR